MIAGFDRCGPVSRDARPAPLPGSQGRVLRGFFRHACDFGVQGGDSGTQTRRDNFRVMLQRGLRVCMPQVALHVFNGRMVLHMRG